MLPLQPVERYSFFLDFLDLKHAVFLLAQKIQKQRPTNVLPPLSHICHAFCLLLDSHDLILLPSCPFLAMRSKAAFLLWMSKLKTLTYLFFSLRTRCPGSLFGGQRLRLTCYISRDGLLLLQGASCPAHRSPGGH